MEASIRGNLKWPSYAAAIAALLALAACAGEPRPSSQLALAASALDAAEHDGAPQRAPQDYSNAQSELANARQAANADKNTDARRLAEDADVDARLSAAKARSVAATNALNQLQGNSAPPAAPQAPGNSP